MAAFVAFRNTTLRDIAILSTDVPDPTDEAYWTQFRSAFTIPSDIIVFNHVGVNPPPKVVEEAMARESRRAAADPSYIMWRKQDHELEGVRKDLAAIIGFSAEEVALVPNATYGLHTAISGVDAVPGDEILLTSQEYPRAFTAADQRSRRHKTVVTTADLGGEPLPNAELLKRITDKITGKTCLVVSSHVTFLLGQILPVGEIGQRCDTAKIPLLVDGAQSVGILPPDGKPAIYAACLHKWMMGPVGTGVLAVRRDWMDRIWPLNPSDFDLHGKISRFEQRGTHSIAPFLALKESIELHHRLGANTKLARLLHLRSEIVRQLDGVRGINFLSSMDPKVCAPFLTLAVNGVKPPDLANTLLTKYRIHVTTANRQDVAGIRISPNLFTSLAEVSQLVHALREISKSAT